MRSAFALRIISGKIILNFAFVALCGALQTHFHGRGRKGKRHLQRRFLRKRGAAGKFFASFQRAEPSQSRLTACQLPRRGSFFHFRLTPQELPPRGSWHCEAMTERVSSLFYCFCFSLVFASRAARLMANTSTSSTAPMPQAEAKSPSSKARRYSSTDRVAPLEV